jgi:phage-related protein
MSLTPLDLSFIKIQDIIDLVKAISDLINTNLNDEAKDALKKLIEQVQNMINKIVDTLSPLYSIVDDGKDLVFLNTPYFLQILDTVLPVQSCS